MGVYRQFTDEQGHSHLAELSREALGKHTDWSPAGAWRLHVHPPGTFLDWHPSDGELLITVLSGVIEIGTSDGETLRCGPGTLRMTSDTGKGHTGRVSGQEPCLVLMVKVNA